MFVGSDDVPQCPRRLLRSHQPKLHPNVKPLWLHENSPDLVLHFGEESRGVAEYQSVVHVGGPKWVVNNLLEIGVHILRPQPSLEKNAVPTCAKPSTEEVR